MNRPPDVIVVGAGIVGAACAWFLQREGYSVDVVDAAPPGQGATAASMGHLVVLDDSEAQFGLCRRSLELWRDCYEALPAACELDESGTLWVAEDGEEEDVARAKALFYRERGVDAHWVEASELRRLEPNLNHDLLGALLVPQDAVVYPIQAARWMLEQALSHGAQLRQGAVKGIRRGTVTLYGGETLHADLIVNAAGLAAIDLMSEFRETVRERLQLRAKKGHLVITDRARGFCRRQIIELGYLKSAHGDEAQSVAFNLQPRRTGQMLIGSCREFDRNDAVVDHGLLSRMLARARRFVPRLDSLSALRVWTGVRPLSRDGLPLIGPAPTTPGVWLATGHEGYGITACLGTAEILTDQILGRQGALRPEPFLPSRFLSAEGAGHGV